jgi:prolyl 4-hydroxylase
MLSVEDRQLKGAGHELKEAIWDVAVERVEEWTGGAKFRPSSLYGIRVYKDGAILSPHVDRYV